ncbi:MAG: hypothetical protein M3154_12080 [Candidatus Eremiobacteraeota bacterium]|nr:hypothetical protein [Candidatus Eremiobacteraeota bacterium]
MRVRFVHPAFWRALAVSASFLVSRADGSVFRDARACNPAWCTLTRPTTAEYAALVAEADRLVGRYATDSTALGRQCAALGATMKAHAADVRMIAYTWRASDPDGNDGPVTGDAHRAELVARTGTGTVHIARGFNPLNPDRGMAAILQTARHEFAHLNGARQTEGGMDEGARIATACGAG